MLISINKHYCAMSQNLFWQPFVNRIIVFKFYFKNVSVFMFSCFGPTFIEKFHWESGFQILVTWLSSRNRIFFFGCHFESERFLMFFLLIYGCFWCIKICCKFCTGTIDIEYNKSLDRWRTCFEDELSGGSNNIVQSNKSVWRRW